MPQEDATVVKRLRKAGGILIGKTNVPEMCFGSTDNLIYGRTNNPYDLSRSPGGSSGGEAAIIAAGGSPFGVGTDIGGSIRDPANVCGIAGIKPTSRRVPDTGVQSSFPLTVADWGAIGPLARYVEDLELVMQIISGPDDVDARVIPMPMGKSRNVPIEQLRVAFFTDDGATTPTEEIRDTVERAARSLETAGAATVKEDRPPCIGQAPDLWLHPLIPSWAASIRYRQREYARLSGTEVSVRRSPIMELVLEWLDYLYKNGDYSPERRDAVQRDVRDFRTQMMRFMGAYDVLLSPVTNIPPGPHLNVDELATLPLADLWNMVKTSSGGYYCTHNLTGYPAVVVRAGTSPEGLPIGVQIAAKAWREDIALAAAKIVENSCGGWIAPKL
jgi:amidase